MWTPAGEGRVSFVDPRDIAEVAATVPVSEDGTGGAPGNGSNRIDGQVYRLTGPEAVTHAQLAEALSVSTGSEIRYVDVPAQDARDALLGTGTPRTPSGRWQKPLPGAPARLPG